VASFLAEGFRQTVEILVALMRAHMSRFDATSVMALGPELISYQRRLGEWLDSPAGLLVKELEDWQNAWSLINHVRTELQAWMASFHDNLRKHQSKEQNSVRSMELPEGVSGEELIGALESIIMQLQSRPVDRVGELPLGLEMGALHVAGHSTRGK
jgi:hypothetical protein